MRVKVLGCSGGIGGSRRTTSFLINDDILIDCGTGVLDLEVEQLELIRHVFLTHTHIDHLAALPLMLDTVQEQFELDPLTLHLTPEADQVVRQDLFNWRLWPNFFDLGDDTTPCIQTNLVQAGDVVETGSEKIEVLPARHSVPAVGYLLRGDNTGTLAFSGDCSENDELWAALNSLQRLDTLIVECSYAGHEDELSRKAKHYSSRTLASDLAKLEHDPEIFITHLKPGSEDLIMQELKVLAPSRNLSELHIGQVFTL